MLYFCCVTENVLELFSSMLDPTDEGSWVPVRRIGVRAFRLEARV